MKKSQPFQKMNITPSKNQKNINRRLRLFALIVMIIASFAGCDRTKPIKIGFVGGVTGRFAALGTSGRNGVLLAVEEVNEAGGVRGRQIELITKDDKQDEKQALVVDQELIDEGVVAIIGHMTSTMSVKVVPLINKEKIVMISPTTSKLAGLDDYFIRMLPQQQSNLNLARYAYDNLGLKKMAIVYDSSNIQYSHMVRDNFGSEFETFGGQIVLSSSFTSGPDIDYISLVKSFLESNPDGVLIVAGSLDTAMICQHIRMSGSEMTIMENGWAGKKELIEHGGPATEGIIFSITYNKDSQESPYIDFKHRYINRFNQDPDFAAVYAYEAFQLLFKALMENTNPAELKETILKQARVDGLQGEIMFDQYGDARRKTYIVEIRQGKINFLK